MWGLFMYWQTSLVHQGQFDLGGDTAESFTIDKAIKRLQASWLNMQVQGNQSNENNQVYMWRNNHNYSHSFPKFSRAFNHI